jgi:hypothetical protein
MVLSILTPTCVAFGTITVQYSVSGSDVISTATATCSAAGSTQPDAFGALEEASAGAAYGAVPANATLLGYNLYNTGITISYAPGGTVSESTPLYRSHPGLDLTGKIRSLNATTGQGLLDINPEKGTISVGAEQLSGTYAGNYDNLNDPIAQQPLLAVSGSRLPNAVFTILHDKAIGDSSDKKNYPTLGARRMTKKYTIAETAPTINSDFGALFGADISYEVEDKTGHTWSLGTTSFGIEGLDVNGNPQGAFSVNMVGIDDNNNTSETCNFRIRNDGTTYVRAINLNGRPVTVDPGTGYLTVGATADI